MSVLLPVFVNASFREDADYLTLPQRTEHGPHCAYIMGLAVDGNVVGNLA
jgi:hypothetical protein